MRTLLVTSDVTYVPRNYAELFETLLHHPVSQHIAGLALLRVASPALLLKAMGLYALGCKNIGATLFRNMLELPLRRRERLFEQRSLPIVRAHTMNSPAMLEWVRENSIDLIVNLRTRCLYNKEILNAPRLGCLNVHHGVLPQYRGTMCDLYAISEGRSPGFSIHVMTEKLDDGVILHTEEIAWTGTRNYISYLERSGQREGLALARLLETIATENRLPEGRPNTADNIQYTKTPGRDGVRKLIQQGMIL